MMWSLWTKCKTYHKLPSEVIKQTDSLAAWMLDSAVTWFGITIENALQERDKVVVGSETRYEPRYTLSRLLDTNFRLVRQPESLQTSNPWAALMAWAGKGNSGVKRYKYQPPEEGKTEDGR